MSSEIHASNLKYCMKTQTGKFRHYFFVDDVSLLDDPVDQVKRGDTVEAEA